MNVLNDLIGSHTGIGVNHLDETFSGAMTIVCHAALNLYTVHYTATLDGTMIHEERLSISKHIDERFHAIGNFSEFNAAIDHNIVYDSTEKLIFRSKTLSQMDDFTNELVFIFKDGVFTYQNRWGTEGKIEDRSYCDFVVLR